MESHALLAVLLAFAGKNRHDGPVVSLLLFTCLRIETTPAKEESNGVIEIKTDLVSGHKHLFH